MTDLTQKAKQIRLVIFDVDGVLTNGKLIYGNNNMEFKSFHVHDGLGMKLLMDANIDVAIITAKQSEIVTRRMEQLGITHVYQGQQDKLPAYENLKNKLQLKDEQIAYVGDDLPDIALLRRVGLPITVANAPNIMKQYAYWVTKTKGGKGAAREVCELILEAQGLYQTAIQKYTER